MGWPPRFYTYSNDGAQRTDNITDWAREEFRGYYTDKTISKEDIFHYVYALLHHPLYRERFAQNLRMDIPRLPMAKDFRTCADIGKELIKLHLGYETGRRFGLNWVENPTAPLSYRVTGRMRLNKEAGIIEVNPSLTLTGIPKAAFDYVLGTRSALEWVLDQYRLEEDENHVILSDPNDPDNEQYIVQLIERITALSLDTMELIRKLPAQLDFVAPEAGRKRSLSM